MEMDEIFMFHFLYADESNYEKQSKHNMSE